MKKKTKQVKIEPGETEIDYVEIEKKENNMIKINYLIIGVVLILITPLTIAWVFNHINPWVAFIIAFLIFLGFNWYFKNKKEVK